MLDTYEELSDSFDHFENNLKTLGRIGQVKFVHIRDADHEGKYLGTAALYDRGPDHTVIVSLALMHPKDQFTKRRGRERCALRIFGRIGVDAAMEVGLIPKDRECSVEDLTEVYEYDSAECACVRELFFQLSCGPAIRKEVMRLVAGDVLSLVSRPWSDEEVTEF